MGLGLGLALVRVSPDPNPNPNPNQVWLNGTRLGCNNFAQYVDLYLGAKLKPGSAPRVSESSERWD